MNELRKLRDQFSCERAHNHETQNKLILEILRSKRLLSEHLESLEEATNVLLSQRGSVSASHLTLLNSSGILLSAYGLFLAMGNNRIRYLIPCAVGVVPIMYLHRHANWKRLLYYEGQLKDFLKSLDDFEFTVKKATSFMNEARFIKSQDDNLQRFRNNQEKNITADIYNLLKKTINGLYCFVKYLEYCFKIDGKLQYFYQEIEDVDNCDLITEAIIDGNIAANKFKELFALFAYVQSYLLFRLGFIIASNINEAKFILKKKICDITAKVKHYTSLLPDFSLVQKEETELQTNIQRLVNDDPISKELYLIRSSTADLTIKVLSLVYQLKEYQENVIKATTACERAGKRQLDEAFNVLNTIGSQLSMCSDEQNRLVILMTKYLKKDVHEPQIIEKVVDVDVDTKKIVDPDDEMLSQQKDDFFYIDSQDSDNFESCIDNVGIDDDDNDLDEEDFELKLTKKCFKPVLAQLKDRIEIINSEMKEREKKILKEKGIHIEEQPDETIDPDERALKYDQKYAESRQLLEEKSQLNIFLQGVIPSLKNNRINLHEDVLE